MNNEQILKEVLQARERIYRAGDPTPLEELELDENFTAYVKREDLSAIKAYKWRGAYNAASVYFEQEKPDFLVTASAGNHAQGVAMAAKHLNIPTKIFMPVSTPQMKQIAVKKLGGDIVEVVLIGDDYNQAADAAKKYLEDHPARYIHPYDDLYTIAGQATIADEIVLAGKGPYDYAFVQIGGGGMAAGVSLWLKTHYPNMKVIGVEGVDQASMKASIDAGKLTTLDKVDTFCDGTAVTRPGDLCFDICRETLDDIITVTNEEVCAAIQKMWVLKRAIPEPSGAMGLAGLMQYSETHADDLKGKKAIAVICGANMDFGKLAMISSRSAVGSHTRRYFRFKIDENKGTLLDLLENLNGAFNVREFQYGKTDEHSAYPVIAFEGPRDAINTLHEKFAAQGHEFEEVTSQADIRYRVINYDPKLMKNPLFFHVHFPERGGALRDFLHRISGITSICYFNYAYTGEAIGRALMGFEFEHKDDQQKFLELTDLSLIDIKPIDKQAIKRIGL